VVKSIISLFSVLIDILVLVVVGFFVRIGLKSKTDINNEEVIE